MNARFEFRHFAQNLSKFHDRFAHLSGDEIIRESDEIYIVGREIHNYNFKIRCQQLDVKKLIAVAGKFEQWFPENKTEFPVSATLLEDAILSQMKISPTLIKKQSYTLTEFAEVSINEGGIHTVPIESTDISKAQQTIESLNLSGLSNINYVKAIKNYLYV